MDGLADTLIGFSEVREVIISDAKDGFLVKTRFFAGMEPSGNGLRKFAKRVSRLG